MKPTTTTVFLVDDDRSIRRALTRRLRAANYDVAAYASADEFLTAKPAAQAGCVILDLQMPGLDGLGLQETLLRQESPFPIIFITGHGTIQSSVQAMKAGAVDFLPKPFESDQLIEAVDRALEKSRQAWQERAVRSRIGARVEQLTKRERAVCEMVVQGLLNKQIAFKLAISEQTVKVHRARVMKKMRAGSVAELVRAMQKVPA